MYFFPRRNFVGWYNVPHSSDRGTGQPRTIKYLGYLERVQHLPLTTLPQVEQRLSRGNLSTPGRSPNLSRDRDGTAAVTKSLRIPCLLASGEYMGNHFSRVQSMFTSHETQSLFADMAETKAPPVKSACRCLGMHVNAPPNGGSRPC